MPGGRDAADNELTDLDHIAVRMSGVRVGDLRRCAGMHRDGTKLGESARARNVVVVNVGLERVCDQHAEPRGCGQIGVDVTVGVDKEGDAGIRVRDEVARVTEASIEDLFDQYRRRIVPARSDGATGAAAAESPSLPARAPVRRARAARPWARSPVGCARRHSCSWPALALANPRDEASVYPYHPARA